MSVKGKVAIGLVMVLLIGGGLINCIKDTTPVWAKVKLDVALERYQILYTDYSNGKIYYTDFDVPDKIMELDPLSGEKSVIKIELGKQFDPGQTAVKGIDEVFVTGDGSIYGLVRVNKEERSFLALNYTVPYLCKFSAKGKMVYATDIREQIGMTGSSYRNNLFHLKADALGRAYLSCSSGVLLYDENGNYDKFISVDDERSSTGSTDTIIELGRDGNIYVYYYGDSYRLARVDYEAGTLVSEQDIMSGELFCFDAEDGFYVKSSEGLYHYATDLPVAGRVAEKVFDWWDLLIYKDTVEMIAAPAKDCVLVAVSSSLEDSNGLFLIQKMPRWKAKEEGYIYVE